MVLERDKVVKPIQYPQRPNRIALETRPPIPGSVLDPEAYTDPRRQGQIHVRFDYQADTNLLAQRTDYHVMSPDDHYIEVDSADEVPQVYYLPPSTSTGIQTLRPIVDTVNNLYISYHFDHRNNRWFKMITRLRKDLHYPQPPVTYNANRVPYYGSRGTRYVRFRKRVTIHGGPDQEIMNRVYFDRAGLSGLETE